MSSRQRRLLKLLVCQEIYLVQQVVLYYAIMRLVCFLWWDGFLGLALTGMLLEL